MWAVSLLKVWCACSHIESLSVLGKAYAPEFYYDTYNPVWQNRHRVYSYSLQWTQMNPDAVDRIVAYRLGIRQVRNLVSVDFVFAFLYSLVETLLLWFLFIFWMCCRIYFILSQYCFIETTQNELLIFWINLCIFIIA